MISHKLILLFTYLLSLVVSASVLAQAQPVYTPKDRQIWISKVKLAPAAPIQQRIITIGQSFTNTPYQSHTLEATPNEQLIVNLRGVDCTTFVESTLALALQLPDTSFLGYCQMLQHLRYRNDTLNGYPSRLHYLSDWLYENQQKGLLEIVTEQLGGKFYDKKLRFMSSHRGAYQQLKEPGNYEALLKVEDALASRKLFYIPKADIHTIEKQLLDGDIIAITTSVPGLDASHVGFIVWKNGRAHLLHASSEAGQVIISPQPLVDYLLDNKSQTGIMVARIKTS
ncbi:MAG: N-acetylmuramoyl-L-alanine amidase-like domain-containing protein [Bacteroidota bacterium]